MEEGHRNTMRTQHVREEKELRNWWKSVTKKGKKTLGRLRERGTDVRVSTF
jgi:hypothetical protein